MPSVRGFREVTGPDGQVEFQFYSSDESDIEPEPVVLPVPAPQPFVQEVSPASAAAQQNQRLIRRYAIHNLDVAEDWNDGAAASQSSNDNSDSDVEVMPLAQPPTSRSTPSTSTLVRHSDISDSEDTDDEPQSPHRRQVANRRNDAVGPGSARIAGNLPGSAGMPSLLPVYLNSGSSSDDESYDPEADPRARERELPSSGPNSDDSDIEFIPFQPRVNRSGRKRREQRQKKKGPSKSTRKALDKQSKPSKVEPPVTIKRNVEVVGRLADCNGNPRSKKSYKLFVPSCSDAAAGTQVYKIGELHFNVPGYNEYQSEFYVQDKPSRSISMELCFVKKAEEWNKYFLVRHEVPVSDEEAQTIEPPKGYRKSRREIKYINVNHYLFRFEVADLLDEEFFEGLRNTALRLDFHHFCGDSETLTVNVCYMGSRILDEHSVSESPSALRKLQRSSLCYFFSMSLPDKLEPQEKEDVEWFYGQIEKFHREEALPEVSDVQHPSLNPTLRGYQRAAVNWMYQKEKATESSVESKLKSVVQRFVDKLAVPVVLSSDEEGIQQTAYFNPYLGHLSWAQPKVNIPLSGGILADEMGLGKTVEVLALILLNPMTNLIGERVADAEAINDECESDLDLSEVFKRKRASSSKVIHVPVKKQKRRAASPCEFEAGHSSSVSQNQAEELPNSSDKTERMGICGLSNSKKIPSGPTPMSDSEDSSPPRKSIKKTKGKRKGYSSKRPNRKTQKSKPVQRRKKSTDEFGKAKVSTYDKVKVLYDAALNEMSATKGLNTRKFHGTFFDTDIKKDARFECLCGDGIEDNAEVLECHQCLSSQHAACVNFDPTRSPSEYLCPHCETSQPPVRSRATLIITPSAISHQWIQEIQRHVKSKHLRILFYKGVQEHGYVPPATFNQYDIVITTYNVLVSDLPFVDLPHLNSQKGRNFRNAKRFMTVPSSLTAVCWWRICLDEAQMVEGIATKMANMASKLVCVNRWCITGTPMNKGLQDLFGLIAFLQVEPVCIDTWWNYLVRVPFQNKDTSALFEFFGEMMWRTSKQNVLDQLGIPPQSHKIHWLSFSALEAHFYKRQFEIASTKICTKIQRLIEVNGREALSARLASLDRQALHSLLQPFLELRQACCHPQIVKGNVLSLQKMSKTMTMEDILDQLMKKTTLQCTDDHRLIIAAMNGLAGLFILSSRWPEAAEMYRSVIKSDEKYEGKIKTDSLQLLHAMENLADLLDRSYVGIGNTLDDDQLRPRAEDIRKKYLQKYSVAVNAAHDMLTPVMNQVIELMTNFQCENESWHAKVISRACIVGKDIDLVRRIVEDLTYKDQIRKKAVKQTTSLASRFTDISGLQFVLTGKLEDLQNKRDDVLGGLDELLRGNVSSLVDPAVYCHLRNQTADYYNARKDGQKCLLCQYHDHFVEYESELFSSEDKKKLTRTGRNRQINAFTGDAEADLTAEERALLLAREEEELLETTEHVNMKMLLGQRNQTWGDSDVEKILKFLANFGKLNGCSMRVQEDAGNHLKLFDVMKKEFKLLRILWRQMYDQVSAIDELGQATTRMRIGSPDEEVPSSSRFSKVVKGLSTGMAEKAEKIMNIHVVGNYEIDAKIEQFQTDCALGKQTLSIHHGQLLYLESLKKNGYGKKGSYNNDCCPICTNPLGHQWSVLICGHSFCSDCVKSLGSRNPASTFLCPMCREPTRLEAVSFIDTTPMEEENSDPQPGSSRAMNQKVIEIKGSHSTKVEAIVETLLRLQETHTGEKVILFSEWVEVLQIIAQALDENDIKYCGLLGTGNKASHVTIQKFKEREDIQVLLMPIHSGSKGLNLIEATHVFLVEPILNIASELQAIGRVHRIGQTRLTYVHRFYVKRTIEEQLYTILQKHDVSSDNEGVLTVRDLQSLVSSNTPVVQLS